MFRREGDGLSVALKKQSGFLIIFLAYEKNAACYWVPNQDPGSAITKGHNTGFVTFTGQESLYLTWSSATSYAYVVDIIGYKHSHLAFDARGGVAVVA